MMGTWLQKLLQDRTWRRSQAGRGEWAPYATCTRAGGPVFLAFPKGPLQVPKYHTLTQKLVLQLLPESQEYAK